MKLDTVLEKISTKFYILLAIILTFSVYLVIFNNEFVWDDADFANWGLVGDFRNLDLFFKGVLPATHLGDFRPFKGIILTISYLISQKDPFGYHLIAIVIHLLNVYLVFLIVLELFYERIRKVEANLLAFLTSLFIGVHPVNTEAITFITASSDTIGITFLFLAFYFYVKASKTFKKRTKNMFFSLVFSAFAFLAYEMTLVLPILLILYDITIGRGGQIKIAKSVFLYFSYLFIIGFYALWRYGILRLTENKDYVDGNFYLTMLAMIKVFLNYLLLFFYPVNLTITHEISNGIFALAEVDFNRNAFIGQNIADIRVLTSLFVISFLVILAIFLYRKLPYVTFCILWFFISLAPVSNIFPLGTLMAEMYMYLSSFGVFLLFSYILVFLTFRYKYGHFTWVFIIGVIIVLCFLSIKRNLEWKNSYTLWSRAVEIAPNSAVSNFNLGNYYHTVGNLEQARKYYFRAYQLNNNRSMFPLFLAEVEAESGNNDLALKYYEEAYLNPSSDFGKYYTLARIKQIKNDETGAIEAYKYAILANPTYFNSHVNLGVLYTKTGKLDKAIYEFSVAKLLDPAATVTYSNLAYVYKQQKEYEKALNELMIASKIDPEDEGIKASIREINEVYRKF